MEVRKEIHMALADAGFTDNETAVYLAGYELGPTGASDIAKKARMNRTLTYHVLDALEQKGLVSKTGTGYGRLFQMEPPSRIKDLLKRQQRDLGSHIEKIESVLPHLKKLKGGSTQPSQIRFYEGVEGLKSVAQEIFESKEKEFLALVPIENIFKAVDESFIRHWLSEREKRGIKSRSIWSQPDARIELKGSLTDMRLVPEDMQPFPATVLVYDNRVVVFSAPEHLFAFVVESDEFSQTMRAVFEQVWKQARPKSEEVS